MVGMGEQGWIWVFEQGSLPLTWTARCSEDGLAGGGVPAPGPHHPALGLDLRPSCRARLTALYSPPAGRQGPGPSAQPPVGAASSPAPSTASRLMGPVPRRLLRMLSAKVCPRSPQAGGPATCSAAQAGVWSPGAR